MGDILKLPLDFSFLNKARKMLKRAIKGRFFRRRKTASRQLSHFQMIGNALTAYPFFSAGFIGTVTPLQIPFTITFHEQITPSSKSHFDNHKTGWHEGH